MSEYVGEYVVSLTPKTFTDLRFHRHEEIVRCRDCDHACEVEGGMYDCLGPLTTSWDYYNDEPQQNLVPPNGFCFHGKRKEVNA